MLTRQVTWGEALWLEIKKARGGLASVHRDVQTIAGKHLGNRITFSKLCRYENAEELDEVDALRAWFLLAALGQEPNAWGISDDVLPPSLVPAAELRRQMNAVRESRLGESNPRPIHYQVTKRARIGELSTAVS